MHINQKLAAWLRRIAIAALCLGFCSFSHSQNIEGQPIASQYSTWQVSGFAPDTYNFVPTACRVQGGASFFAAFAVGTPVKIVDGNPSLSETVTPTNVVINNTTCSIAVAPVNHHNLPYYLTSATGGLQEAINANFANPASNTIVLDNKFYVSVGPSNVAAVINDVIGFTTLGLVDITQAPYVWYQWNGSHYVPVSVGGDVQSVFGRTGHVIAETGDYNCDQVTGCGPSPNIAFNSALSAAINATATTIPLSASTAGLNVPGAVVIDSEWIQYTGVSGNSLTGAVRHYHQTAGASHAQGAIAFSVIADFGNVAQLPENYIGASAGAFPSVTTIGCATPDEQNEASLQIGCPGVNETFIDALKGGINQTNGTGSNKLEASTGIGPGGGAAPITNSGFLLDATRQNQAIVPIGFGAGLAGPVESVQPLTIGAPSVLNFSSPAGSTTWSYECTGTDIDGNTFPGTVASITNGPATMTGGFIDVTCPYAAGAASQSIWRTAGGPNQGLLLSSSVTGQPITDPDSGSAVTAGTPPSTNSSIPKLCVAGEQYCSLSGLGGTPPVACSGATQGWTYQNVSAVTAPFSLVCNGTAWVANGGGGGGAVSSVFGRTGAVAATSGDYTVSQVTGAAPIASPALTGVPTAPTASPGTSTTQVATTAFVASATGTNVKANEFVLSAAGSQNFAHNLNSMYPMWSCFTKSGAQWNTASVAPIDANDVSYTSAGATDTVCNFSAGGVIPPDFALSVSPTAQTHTISGGGTQTVPYTVTQTALNGYTGTTTPSCTSLASGMSCGFSPTTMTGSATSTLTLSFPSTQAAATTNFNISATDGTLTHTTPAAITVIANSLLDSWLMNEASGTTFLDTNTSNANNQTFLSSIGSWGTVSGFPGSVFTFNGTGFSTGSNNTLTNFDGTTPFSVSFWFKIPSIPTQNDFIGNLVGSAPFTGWQIVQGEAGGAGYLDFLLINTFPSNAIVVNSPPGSVLANTLYFATVTYDGSQTVAGTNLYLNGVNQTLTTQSGSLSASTANSNPVSLGGNLQESFFLDGTMADVRIFNTQLSSGAISTLFSGGPQ